MRKKVIIILFIVIVICGIFSIKSQYFVNNNMSKGIYYDLGNGFNINSVTKDLHLNINFDHCGINELFSIKQIGIKNDKDDVTITSCTDWVGPYIVKAKNQDTEEFVESFTGGWHEDITGSPTAKTIGYKIYADNKEIEGPSFGQAYKIEVVVNNEIKGFNTDEFILAEIITYTISESEIDIHVEIKALKDLSILKYYGLQTQNTGFDKEIKYLFQDRSLITKDINTVSDSGCKNDCPKVVGFTLSGKKHPFKFSTWIDLNDSLTSFDYLSKEKPYAFTEDYGKSYFNFIDGIQLNMEAGEEVYWTGGYSFCY